MSANFEDMLANPGAYHDAMGNATQEVIDVIYERASEYASEIEGPNSPNWTNICERKENSLHEELEAAYNNL